MPTLTNEKAMTDSGVASCWLPRTNVRLVLNWG